MTTIEVAIWKDASRRWLNHYVSYHWRATDLLQGIRWDGKTLVFGGTSLEEVYAVAERFYRACAEEHELRNVCARMRHRFGHNGHGWPEDERSRGPDGFAAPPA